MPSRGTLSVFLFVGIIVMMASCVPVQIVRSFGIKFQRMMIDMNGEIIWMTVDKKGKLRRVTFVEFEELKREKGYTS